MQCRAFAATLVLVLSASTAYAVPIAAPAFEASDELAIVDSSTDVDIAGVVARVTIRQTYLNRSGRTIESRYVFPSSTNAAVDGLKMQIGDRTIEAKIKARDDAKRTYEVAKNEGKTATLLEQHRPNVFETSVANIQPGERIVVTLSYTELLVPEERVYELVLPQVVKDRYDPEAWGARTAPERAPAVQVRVDLRAGMKVSEFRVPSHDVTAWVDGDHATVSLVEQNGFDRDVVVRYRLAGDHVQTGVLLNEGPDGGEFLLMVQPPARVAPNAIPPREFVFIVDVSGSMNGFPLDVSVDLMRSLVGDLRPFDRFNVLCFAASNQWLAEAPIAPTAENLERAIHMIRTSRSGGTRLSAALERALAAPRQEGVSTNFVLITDGFITAETRAFDLVEKHRGEANVFTFGIGPSVNRHLIESLAKVGLGHPFIAANAAEAERVAKRFEQYVSSPVLTNVRLRADGIEIHDIEPRTIPDVLADRPVVILGKYRGQPRGSLTIEGRTGSSTPFVARMPLEITRERHPSIPTLWARSRVDQLSIRFGVTRDPKIGDEIERLGLAYKIMTERTSFVAVDNRPRSVAKVAAQTSPKPTTSITATPELDPGAAGAAMLLLLATLALLFDRRRA